MLFKTAKRIVIFVLGMSVLLIGVALVVLPGPAFLVIPAGLAILATEFAWARNFLRAAKQRIRNMSSSSKQVPAPTDEKNVA